MVAIFLFGMFAIHVKNQFADSRARLTPGFRRVHATVAAAAALLLAVLLPIVLIWLADLRSLGLVALVVFLFGAILCSVALHSDPVIVPVIVARHPLVFLHVRRADKDTPVAVDFGKIRSPGGCYVGTRRGNCFARRNPIGWSERRHAGVPSAKCGPAARGKIR